MKEYHITVLLFFIAVFGLQYWPGYCDKKRDDSQQNPQPVSSGTQDLPTTENEAKKVKFDTSNNSNVVLEKPLKESIIQPNVEYVNSEVENKDANQMGSIESLHSATEDTKSNPANLKPSINVKEVNINAAGKSTDDKISKSISKDEMEIKTSEMKSIPEVVMKSPVTHFDAFPEKTPVMVTTPTTQFSTPISLASDSMKLIDENAQQQYDGMPSFDEWKKMMLAEQEKGGQKVPSSPPGKKISSQKRRRNYASYECGAKIVSANGEAEGTSRILNELVDEYMLNPCKAKIWFVIELCETVQASQIELANFELFSSCPRDFVVSSSNNFPTRDWVSLGTFTAAEQRVLQSFELKQEGFGKFIKIELLSYYGEEHYCPLSVVRIFGTSMVDEYEEMETLASHPDIPEDDLDRLDIPIEDKKSTNLFGSATDAVMNIVKKAAQALGQQPADEKKVNETSADSQNISETKACNVLDTSRDECKAISPVAKGSQTVLLSPLTMSSSVLRLLRNCDQCSSDIQRCSSAKPHCRFFQAALGPVVFQTLCDWIREHPLTSVSESSATGKNRVHAGDFILSPTKSPPPQIVRVPLESDTTVDKFLNKSLFPSEMSVTANTTSVTHALNESVSDLEEIELQPSIRPTQTFQNGDSSLYNRSKTDKLYMTKERILSSDTIQNVHPEASAVLEKIEKATHTISETVTPSVAKVLPTSDLLTDTEEQQINDFLSDPSIVTSEDISMEISPATELPVGFKSTEEKMLDVRGEASGRFEAVHAAGQKESVFMRMNNRIKALEINMSLSSQYLQELSQRYRRQMDDMQRAFNRTIGTLNDTARKAAEKDLKQQEVLNNLQLQVANLTTTVQKLVGERSYLLKQMVETHICFMIIEVIVIIVIMSLYIRHLSNMNTQERSVERTTSVTPSRLSKRRNSADSCTPPIARKVKKRSNSEEIFNAEALIVEPLPVLLDPILKARKKNKKRNKGIHRSMSHSAVQKCSKSSLCSGNQHTHSEGCVVAKSNLSIVSQHPSHACENCDNNVCTRVPISCKENRRNCMPLQNLTNGTVVAFTKERTIKGREKFSIKKFLRFQKRDSI